jgi:hypothetical protein
VLLVTKYRRQGYLALLSSTPQARAETLSLSYPLSKLGSVIVSADAQQRSFHLFRLFCVQQTTDLGTIQLTNMKAANLPAQRDGVPQISSGSDLACLI